MGNETKKGNNSGAANTPAITKEDRAKIIEKAAEELKAKAAEVTQQAVAAPPPPLTNKDGLTKEQLEEALKEAKEKGQQVMIKMLEQAIVDFPTVLPGAGAKKAPTDKNARIKLIQKIGRASCRERV